MAIPPDRIAEQQMVKMKVEMWAYSHPKPTKLALIDRSPLDIYREVRQGTAKGTKFVDYLHSLGSHQASELLEKSKQNNLPHQKLRILRIVAWEFWNVPGEVIHEVRKNFRRS